MDKINFMASLFLVCFGFQISFPQQKNVHRSAYCLNNNCNVWRH